MRTIRIRTFMMLIFFFVLLVPWIFFLITHFMETRTLNIDPSGLQEVIPQQPFSEVAHLIETNSSKWRDPEWQNQLQTMLRQSKLEAIIQSVSGQDIYRSNQERDDSVFAADRFTIIEDGQQVGKIIIYAPKSNTVPMISIVAGLLLASFIAVWGIRRFLLNPLEGMSYGARQIAAGAWEAELPGSRIAEITEVRDAFKVMVKGLHESFQKQVELEEERRFVIAAVAHDLRTPLFALRGYLDGLEQGIAQSPDKMAKYLAVCKEKSLQLDRLVEDLFTFTKMEYLEMKLHNQTFDFQRIIRKSIDSLSPLARQKHITILNDIADECFVTGDMHLWERAMSNILDNALRHTSPSGEITVQCYKDGDKIKFTVLDSGPGFSTEELPRIFEPLYRGEESRNRATGGSGLGLTISQKIARRHGGDLAASNHPEGGALLTGWIPAQ